MHKTEVKEITIAENATSSEASLIVDLLDYPVIFSVLKNTEAKNKPLTASQISDSIFLTYGSSPSEKTILRKLKSLQELQDKLHGMPEAEQLRQMLGGTLITKQSKQGNDGKPHFLFDFQPVLSNAESSMILGSIISNRYFSSKERKKLIAQMNLLSNTTMDALLQEDQSLLADSSDSYVLLNHINQLNDAIENKYQISLVYGTYQTDYRNRPKLKSKNDGKPYILNPYALLWNNGQYYLLATYNNHTNPVHFRVDRIVSLKPYQAEKGPGKNVKRASLPQELKLFFEKKESLFNAIKYTATYPLMGIYDNEALIDCTVECTTSSLSLLIDTFGKDITIKPSKDSVQGVDLHGKPQNIFIVSIRQVQFDNALLYFQQNHNSFKVIGPEQLVDEIKKKLTQSLSNYI